MTELPANLDPFGEIRRLDQVELQGRWLRVGDRVRLRPQGRSDILDLALAGRLAVVRAIEQELDDRVQLAVVLEDDPGRDMGELRQPGHQFFYRLGEVELL